MMQAYITAMQKNKSPMEDINVKEEKSVTKIKGEKKNRMY